ncbi:uncharacterized protein LOC126907048 isoform X2 [Daktulosphaira vitifoliae]|nr:uncharacterized protein LOC126907048 isoform X2 [Daktulosphaira vitifoliae]
MTVCLGCVYVKFINEISLVISNILQICQKQIQEEKDLIKGCICTEELVYIISLIIVPLITLMQGAMDALDLIHKYPHYTLVKSYCTINIFLESFRNIIDDLNILTLSRDNVSVYIWTLNFIDYFIKIKLKEIKFLTDNYCVFVSYDPSDLWNKWVQEYNTIIDHGKRFVFIKFLKKKIENNVKTVIKEQYIQLGFKFDPITEETFVATRNDPIKIELELNAIDD